MSRVLLKTHELVGIQILSRYFALFLLQFLAISDFPLRDPSRPRARGIGMITARDLVEPRCLPPTTRSPHAARFPPTNGFLAAPKGDPQPSARENSPPESAPLPRRAARAPHAHEANGYTRSGVAPPRPPLLRQLALRLSIQQHLNTEISTTRINASINLTNIYTNIICYAMLQYDGPRTHSMRMPQLQILCYDPSA